MDISVFKEKAAAYTELMNDKGLPMPHVEFWIREDYTCYLRFLSPLNDCNEAKFFHHEDPAALLALTEEYLHGLPSLDAMKKTEWHKTLAKLLEDGRDLGLSEKLINPLEIMMEELSSNILEHQVDPLDDQENMYP